MATFTYEFEDEGQDLMSFTVKDGVIIDVSLDTPILRSLYVGKLHYDYFGRLYPNKPLKVGEKFRYSESPDHEVLTIRYPVSKVLRGRPGKAVKP